MLWILSEISRKPQFTGFVAIIDLRVLSKISEKIDTFYILNYIFTPFLLRFCQKVHLKIKPYGETLLLFDETHILNDKFILEWRKEKNKMAYKEHRELKVYEGSGRNYKATPQIRLQGDWLKDFDFEIGTPINVECRGGAILITRADTIFGKAVEL